MIHYIFKFYSKKSQYESDGSKIVTNITWLLGDSVARLLISLIVGSYVARYLGVSNYGVLNYAMSMVAIFSILGSAGLNSVAVRELVRNKDKSNSILGSIFTLQAIGNTIAACMATVTVVLLKSSHEEIKLMVIILSFALPFRALDAVKYWFESQVLSKSVVIVENVSVALSALLKCVLVLMSAHVVYFCLVVVVESIIVTAGMYIIYSGKGEFIGKWKIGLKGAWDLLKESWPALIAAIAGILYMRIDQLMLGEIIGVEAVGIFSSAVRVSEIWYFLPMAVATSMFPSIIDAKKISQEIYYQKLQNLHEAMFVISVIAALSLSVSAEILIKIMFGDSFRDSVDVLRIHAWGGVFLALSLASGRWFLSENLLIFSVYRTAAGAIINIGLNLILIPPYGTVGAAVSTVISQLVSGVLINGLFKTTRPVFIMQIKSVFCSETIRQIRNALGR